MWFAALGDINSNPWLYMFMQRLLEGNPQVIALLAENPFPEHPPKYIRCQFYDYRFTDREARKQTGDWWERTLLGTYSPRVSLKENESFLHL